VLRIERMSSPLLCIVGFSKGAQREKITEKPGLIIPSEEKDNNLEPQNATIARATDVLLNIEDYHQAAKRKLSKMAYDYYQTGADDELTLHENTAAFRRIKLRPSVLVDVSHHDKDSNSCSVRLLNGQTTCSFPVLIAPTAKQRLADDRGELSTARAAVRANTVMIVSMFATRSLEEVAYEHQRSLAEYPTSTSQLWFQLYVVNDRQLSAQLAQRAEQAGYRAIVLTVDACRDGNREADFRNRCKLPEHMKFENFYDSDLGLTTVPSDQISTSNKPISLAVDTSITWPIITWLRQITKLPIIVKGIMTSEDARLAVKAGVDGIVVSNHGGRELDTTQSTIEVLPEIVAAVSEENNITNNKLIDIYIDGGIRRGTDILKALALGAKAVLVGRPILWGLAVNGCEGVVDILEIFRREFKLAMILCGCTTMPRTKILILPS
jgi:isopentenyl diphosphate isomerase/L-lactate dehydrogenase-like FMN-dependent dehydrogenase